VNECQPLDRGADTVASSAAGTGTIAPTPSEPPTIRIGGGAGKRGTTAGRCRLTL
jgi:hypothetical protein